MWHGPGRQSRRTYGGTKGPSNPWSKCVVVRDSSNSESGVDRFCVDTTRPRPEVNSSLPRTCVTVEGIPTGGPDGLWSSSSCSERSLVGGRGGTSGTSLQVSTPGEWGPYPSPVLGSVSSGGPGFRLPPTTWDRTTSGNPLSSRTPRSCDPALPSLDPRFGSRR